MAGAVVGGIIGGIIAGYITCKVEKKKGPRAFFLFDYDLIDEEEAGAAFTGMPVGKNCD